MFALSAVIVVGFLFLLKTSYTEGFQLPPAPPAPAKVLDKFITTSNSGAGTTLTVSKADLVNAAGGEDKQLVDVKVFALNSDKNNFNLEIPRKTSSGVEQVLGSGTNMKLEFGTSPTDGTSAVVQYNDSTNTATTKLPLRLNDPRLSGGLKLLNTSTNNLSVPNSSGQMTQLASVHGSGKTYNNSFLSTGFASNSPARNKNILVRFIFN